MPLPPVVEEAPDWPPLLEEGSSTRWLEGTSRTDELMPMWVEEVSLEGGGAGWLWLSKPDADRGDEAEDDDMMLRRGCVDDCRVEFDAGREERRDGGGGGVSEPPARVTSFVLRRGARGGFVEDEGTGGAGLPDDGIDGRGGRGGSEPAMDDADGVGGAVFAGWARDRGCEDDETIDAGGETGKALGPPSFDSAACFSVRKGFVGRLDEASAVCEGDWAETSRFGGGGGGGSLLETEEDVEGAACGAETARWCGVEEGDELEVAAEGKS